MTNNLLSILTTTVIFCNASGQDFATYLKQHAVKIERWDSLNEKVYKLLYDNRLIMLGEMHGTNEPAKFLLGLTKLFTDHGDSVQVGFEIPASAMTDFLNLRTDSSILQSEFFAKSSGDGRASAAWAATISSVNQIPKAQIFFYDVEAEDFNERRDSVMYLNIKRKLMEHPTWKTITICGGVHNMLLPFRGEKKAAYHLSNDSELNLQDNLCSLHLRYQYGSANVKRKGSALQITDVGVGVETEYSSTVDYANYLFLFPINYYDTYDGVFFTRLLTPSRLANE